MPVKIVDNAIPSNNSTGVISLSDLQKVKDNFIDQINLQPINGRTRIIKKFSCYIFKSQIDELFVEHPDLTILKINFGVQLENITDCNGRNCSDNLTVVIEAAKEGADPGNIITYTNIGDFVIIPSFKSDNDKFALLNAPCCPSGNP